MRGSDTLLRFIASRTSGTVIQFTLGERIVAGSVWRKIDLHVHVPNTIHANEYEQERDSTADQRGVWKVNDDTYDRFFRLLHQSGVEIVGLVDYFEICTLYDAIDWYEHNYQKKFQQLGDKLYLIPNLEIRMDRTVNRRQEIVDGHIILNPEKVDRNRAQRLLTEIKTETTDQYKRPLSIADLDKASKGSASVSLNNLRAGLDTTFGEVDAGSSYRVLFPLNGNGIRSNTERGHADKSRRDILSDEYDKFCDGVFGNAGSADHFLRPDRWESDEISPAKPVFSGSDAHSWESLEHRVGKMVAHEGLGVGSAAANTCWIKAEKSFGGFSQCFIDPAQRVKIQENNPDAKRPDQVIEYIEFKNVDGRKTFPDRINFNPGLNVIIGSRSSGKSTLLAYIAYSINRQQTIDRQEAIDVVPGPAPGYPWENALEVRSVWRSQEEVDPERGQMVFVPQNALFNMSSRPEEVTSALEKSIPEHLPGVADIWSQIGSRRAETVEQIKQYLAEYENLSREREKVVEELALQRTAEAIEQDIVSLRESIETIVRGTATAVSNTEDFDSLVAEYDEKDRLIRGQISTFSLLGVALPRAEQPIVVDVAPFFSINRPTNLSSSDIGFAKKVMEVIESVERRARQQLAEELNSLANIEYRQYRDTLGSLEGVARELFPLYRRRAELSGLQALEKESFERSKDLEKLKQLQKRESQLSAETKLRLESVVRCFTNFNEWLKEMVEKLDGLTFERRSFNDITVSIDIGRSPSSCERASEGFNFSSSSAWLDRQNRQVRFDLVEEDPAGFLADLTSGVVRLRKSYSPTTVAESVFTSLLEARLCGVLDDDKIGGFGTSTMTPGKQALFALKVLIGSERNAWPILLDQPEDDLDSRSIYNLLVSELSRVRTKRQVFVVTHDANVAVGPDSDLIIVADRAVGDDDQSTRIFSYRTGGLESGGDPDAEGQLWRDSIESHVCQLLDGGRAAFEKRARRYGFQSDVVQLGQ